VCRVDVKENKKHNKHCIHHPPLRLVTKQEQQNQMSEIDVAQLNKRQTKRKREGERRM
jgi:hypothetical protein